ncbi:protein EVI2B [Podarcis muralis]
MDSRAIVLVFFYGQLWWNVSTTLPITTTAVVGTGGKNPIQSYETSEPGDPVKFNQQTPTTQPQVPAAEDPKPHDGGHFIAAVVIGVILTVMIVIIVGIFLWRRWRRSATPVPHWAGRSPFADGEVPDTTADKEPSQDTRRTSVLSFLPWKFNKDTQLLENAQGQLSESSQGPDVPPICGAEESGMQSSSTATASSASMQTAISEEPCSLIDVPLQSDSPEPLDLPPPPNWLDGANEDLCPKQTESLSLEPIAEIQGSGSLVLSHQIPGEELLLPPPPEDLLSN